MGPADRSVSPVHWLHADTAPVDLRVQGRSNPFETQAEDVGQFDDENFEKKHDSTSPPPILSKS